MDSSAFELFERGGVFMGPLIALSVFSLAISIDRLTTFVANFERFETLVQEIQPLARAGKLESLEETLGSDRPYRKLARVYVRCRRMPREARENVLRREGTKILDRLERRVRWLGVIGQVSPLVGLAGTVWGLVAAFRQIEDSGAAVMTSDLAGGIWQALLTTVFGLAITIPSLFAFHAFEGHVARISRNLGELVSYLDEWTSNEEA